MVDKKPFWDYASRYQSDIYSICHGLFLQKALAEGKPFWQFSLEGSLAEGQLPEYFIEKLIRKTSTTLLHYRDYRFEAGCGVSEYIWYLNNAEVFCVVKYTPNGTLAINSWTTSTPIHEEISALSMSSLRKPEKKGKVYMLTTDSVGGFKLGLLGVGGETFLEDNYAPSVVNGYRHVVKDLNSKDPCGRVVILDGVPGCGKTHAIRAMLNEVPRATFVLVPVTLLSQLDGPGIIPVFMRYKESGYPMVLILEDADEAIVNRKDGNLSQISALLNLSDGILGSQLDLRLIATTNRDMSELDAATVRPGRLCQRIEVCRLDARQAQKVYRRLGGSDESAFSGEGFFTLAEVYAAARNEKTMVGDEKQSKPVAKGRIGFTQPSIKGKYE